MFEPKHRLPQPKTEESKSSRQAKIPNVPYDPNLIFDWEKVGDHDLLFHAQPPWIGGPLDGVALKDKDDQSVIVLHRDDLIPLRDRLNQLIQTRKEPWDCHAHRDELRVHSTYPIVYHLEEGVLCYGREDFSRTLAIPVEFKTPQLARAWIERGTIAELQESLSTLQVGFTTRCFF